MPVLLFRRDTHEKQFQNDDESSLTRLLITLVVLLVLCMVLAGSLYVLHRHRSSRKKARTLPSYEDSTRDHNRLTIQTSRNSTFIFSEKETLINKSSPMPLSPDNVPEIRITFPEEEDKDGRRVSGRVMVVQVGEAGVGFVKPMENGDLPPYNVNNDRYASIDLECIGGLKEVR